MSVTYGMQQDDVWWTASDLGWVVGHSYICYGPLLYGITSVMYEGKPDRTPDPGQYFRVIHDHQVKALFTVPTVFRVIRREDPECTYGKRYSIESLKRIFIAGEHCDYETKKWAQNMFNVPLINHWWQTETGHSITATCVQLGHNLYPPKYSAGMPFPGYDGKYHYSSFAESMNRTKTNTRGKGEAISFIYFVPIITLFRKCSLYVHFNGVPLRFRIS